MVSIKVNVIITFLMMCTTFENIMSNLTCTRQIEPYFKYASYYETGYDFVSDMMVSHVLEEFEYVNAHNYLEYLLGIIHPSIRIKRPNSFCDRLTHEHAISDESIGIRDETYTRVFGVVYNEVYAQMFNENDPNSARVAKATARMQADAYATETAQTAASGVEISICKTQLQSAGFSREFQPKQIVRHVFYNLSLVDPSISELHHLKAYILHVSGNYRVVGDEDHPLGLTPHEYCLSIGQS